MCRLKRGRLASGAARGNWEHVTQNARGYVQNIGLFRCLVPWNSMSAWSGTIAVKGQARASIPWKQKPVLSVARAMRAWRRRESLRADVLVGSVNPGRAL